MGCLDLEMTFCKLTTETKFFFVWREITGHFLKRKKIPIQSSKI